MNRWSKVNAVFGALLCGAVLGTNADARAGFLTWDGDTGWTSAQIGSYETAELSSWWGLSGGSLTVASRGLFDVTAADEGGFSATLVSTALSGDAYFEVTRAFSVSGGGVDVTLFGSAEAGTSFGIMNMDTWNQVVYYPDSAAWATTITLGDGNYYVRAGAYVTSGTSYTGEVFGFSVPAPGACAVLGAAALLRRRSGR